MCPFLWSLEYFVSILHASPRAHRSCLSVSSWDRPSNFGAYGLRSWGLVRWITPNTKRWTLAFPNFWKWRSVFYEICTPRAGLKTFCALPKNRTEFRRLDVLNYATQLSWILQHGNSTFVTMLFSVFCWADLQAARARKHTDHRICIPDFFL